MCVARLQSRLTLRHARHVERTRSRRLYSTQERPQTRAVVVLQYQRLGGGIFSG